ncbi:hypothetical protein HOS00_gp06 [Klebsiella phage AltoGao]|uniref:Uncharacterized protein n=1 Tax=Klebsiella phage AltoGao TaxID=2026943 RepID=A0A248SKI4_9CAUD|nr:hypothetical protein HOS00_gp06 [Klebsiella phage AltoGao]ASV44899.1 hypothetical protein AltoGao_6 [Klebsiella phage AltoGao]
MKVLKFIRKSEALRIADANPGAIKCPYCTGKYDPMPARVLCEEVKVSDDIVAVYAERRYGSFGPYTKLMCVRLVSGGGA